MDFLIEQATSTTPERVTCVVRLAGKQEEYVNAEGRHDLLAGELTVTGLAVPHSVDCGPCRSHKVTVWTFIGPTKVGKIQLPDLTRAELG